MSQNEKQLPWGEFKDVRSSEDIDMETDKIMPWLGKRKLTVKTVKVTLDDGQSFKLGSVIKKSSKTAGLAHELSQQESNALNNSFYREIAGRVKKRGTPPQLQRGNNDVSYVKHLSGARLYFVDSEIQGERTIITVAACKKNKENQVTGLITGIPGKFKQS